MRFLMDTNICSAYMRRAGGITHRMIQYGQENVAASALSLAELYSGAFQRPELRGLLAQIDQTFLKRGAGAITRIAPHLAVRFVRLLVGRR